MVPVSSAMPLPGQVAHRPGERLPMNSLPASFHRMLEGIRLGLGVNALAWVPVGVAVCLFLQRK